MSLSSVSSDEDPNFTASQEPAECKKGHENFIQTTMSLSSVSSDEDPNVTACQEPPECKKGYENFTQTTMSLSSLSSDEEPIDVTACQELPECKKGYENFTQTTMSLSSDEEPNFTACQEPAEGKKAYDPEEAFLEASGEEEDPLHRKYTAEDLIPTELDPTCKPDWPLAAFWPVYVGNFKVENFNIRALTEQVSNYFAYRGLLTRMMFFGQQEDPNDCLGKHNKRFASYRTNCKLTDMLVYFTSKADAERAISICHHESYYGYKLNVLPGRTPVYFDTARSLQFTNVDNTCPSELRVEETLSKYGPVTFVGRYPTPEVVAEMATRQAMVAYLRGLSTGNTKKWIPMALRKNQRFMKQRFLEADMIMRLDWILKANPNFINQQPNPGVLMRLFEGLRPNVPTPWKGHSEYVKSSKALQKIRWKKRRERRRQYEKRHGSQPDGKRSRTSESDQVDPSTDMQGLNA